MAFRVARSEAKHRLHRTSQFDGISDPVATRVFMLRAKYQPHAVIQASGDSGYGTTILCQLEFCVFTTSARSAELCSPRLE